MYLVWRSVHWMEVWSTTEMVFIHSCCIWRGTVMAVWLTEQVVAVFCVELDGRLVGGTWSSLYMSRGGEWKFLIEQQITNTVICFFGTPPDA